MSASRLRSESGQMITEAVLILVILMGFTMMVSSYLKKEEVFKKLIRGPWVQLAGVLQNGVWATPEEGAKDHPNAHVRHIAFQGDPK